MIKNFFIQSVVRTFYPLGASRKVLFGLLKGTKFLVAPGFGLTYALGIDSMNWRFLRKKVRPGMVVFDVGANRGQMGLFFSKMTGDTGKVYCFEPMKHLAGELARNLKINNIENVEVLPYALAEKNGVTKFLFSDLQSTQGKIALVEPTYTLDEAHSVDVDIRSIDSLLKSGLEVPQLLKIDVEGAAALVFSGATNLLDQHPDIYLELHGPAEQQAIGDYLLGRGYKFKDMDGNSIADPVVTWCSPIWCSVES